jgi:hypothetical protein
MDICHCGDALPDVIMRHAMHQIGCWVSVALRACACSLQVAPAWQVAYLVNLPNVAV